MHIIAGADAGFRRTGLPMLDRSGRHDATPKNWFR